MTVVRVAAGIASLVTAFWLQATVISPLAVPLSVSLPAVLVAAVAVYAGPATGLTFGFSAGLIADLLSHHPVGVLALTWLGLGVAAGMVGGVVLTPAPLRSGPLRAVVPPPGSYLARSVAARRPREASVRRVAAAVGLLAAAAGLASAVLLALIDAGPATVGAELVRSVPSGVLDAVLALAVVPAVRTLLAAAALRPAPAVPEPARALDGVVR